MSSLQDDSGSYDPIIDNQTAFQNCQPDTPQSTLVPPSFPAGRTYVLGETTYQSFTTYVPPEPPSPVLYQQYPYLAYDIKTFIEEDMGYLQQAVAGPAGLPSQIARVHGGKGIKVITFFALRLGAKPVIPSFNTSSSNEVLMGRAQASSAPGWLLDGSPACWASAVYVYALRKMPTEEDNITLGAQPFTTQAANDNQIQPSDYDGNLISPSTLPNGAPTTYLNY